VEQERPRDVRHVGPELVPVEEGRLDLRPAGRARDREHDEPEEDARRDERDRRAARVARQPERAERARAARPGLYFRTGAPVAFASHCCWSFFSVPSARSFAITASVQRVSPLPFANTSPKRSPPPSAGNCPRIFEFGTCTAVT